MSRLTRRRFLARSGAIAGAAVAPAFLPAGEQKQSKPNVILCMTDDQGWGDTGYNGHPVLRTPYLDRMSKEGIRFDRFYSGAPVCSPTRGSCLTGRHPYRYGIVSANSGHMKPQEITLAEVLKEEGYATGHFGKWHLGTLTTEIKDSNRGRPGRTKHYSPPWENGFDECFSTEAKVPTYWRKDQYENYGTYYWTGPEEKVPAEKVSGDDSRLIMDSALPFIKKSVERDRPFLAVIWFHAPHLPVDSDEPYTNGYKKHEKYYGCLTAMDRQMGRLRETLRSLGVEKNTMLWFCSDNGPERGTAGVTSADPDGDGEYTKLRARKRSLYEGGVRVPGLLVWPNGVKKNRVVKMPCSTSDYFPTVLDVLGYRLPESKARPYDGVSLLPLINAKMSERPRPIGFQSRNQISLTGNRYKIYSGNRGKSYQMYDLIEDPSETNDVSGRHPQIFKSMKQTIEDWRKSCRQSARGGDY